MAPVGKAYVSIEADTSNFRLSMLRSLARDFRELAESLDDQADRVEAESGEGGQ